MEFEMKAIEYILTRSKCLSIITSPDGIIIAKAMHSILKNKRI